MIMHDVTKMPIIGKVTTKPLTYNVTFGDKTQAYEMPAETYSVVHIFEEMGQKTYVTNIWHKEYKRVPLLIIEKIVDKYEPMFEIGGVFQGSPYDFNNFSTEYIGTGEGQQVFGWGLYFTDIKDIAKEYAKNESLIEQEISKKSSDLSAISLYSNIPSEVEYTDKLS